VVVVVVAAVVVVVLILAYVYDVWKPRANANIWAY
jgi:hypothetical protein